MADIMVYYQTSSFSSAANTVIRALESRIDDYNGIISRINNVSTNHLYLLNATNSIRQKTNELNDKKAKIQSLRDSTTSYVEYAKQVDKNVAEKIKKDADTLYKEVGIHPGFWSTCLNIAKGYFDFRAETENFITGLFDTVDEWWKDLISPVTDWYQDKVKPWSEKQYWFQAFVTDPINIFIDCVNILKGDYENFFSLFEDCFPLLYDAFACLAWVIGDEYTAYFLANMDIETIMLCVGENIDNITIKSKMFAAYYTWLFQFFGGMDKQDAQKLLESIQNEGLFKKALPILWDSCKVADDVYGLWDLASGAKNSGDFFQGLSGYKFSECDGFTFLIDSNTVYYIDAETQKAISHYGKTKSTISTTGDFLDGDYSGLLGKLKIITGGKISNINDIAVDANAYYDKKIEALNEGYNKAYNLTD